MDTPNSAQRFEPSKISMTTFGQMVERLVSWHPMAIGQLSPKDSNVALLRMQSGLCLSPEFCSLVYCELADSYQLRATDTTMWWVSQQDVSLGELHRRLWHEADMAAQAALAALAAYHGR